MKKMFLTSFTILMVSIALMAQSQQEGSEKNSPKQNEIETDTVLKDQSTLPEEGRYRKFGPAKDKSSSSSPTSGANAQDSTVTQKEKRNKPGKRSQVGENETGKDRKPARDNPD